MLALASVLGAGVGGGEGSGSTMAKKLDEDSGERCWGKMLGADEAGHDDWREGDES